jgi:hypothetical protein
MLQNKDVGPCLVVIVDRVPAVVIQDVDTLTQVAFRVRRSKPLLSLIQFSVIPGRKRVINTI